MIPEAFIHDLVTRVDIVDIVGRHVQLKKGGVNLKGLCPFHAEKSPSFTVSPAKQFYHCFGCGASGDAIRFLTEFSGMSFVDAVRDLAQQAGLNVPEDESSPVERERAAAQRERRATLGDAMARAAAAYRKQLKASPRAIDYLKGRGLSGEISARFGLGYAPDGWRHLAGVFPSYDDPLLEEGGLVIAKEAEGDAESTSGERKRYDRFRDRIMFPIRSVQGEVIGFGARVLDRGEPKYLNSPETPIFSKGRELYGLFEARMAVRERGHALVVEGYMDVVALAQSGIGNAVATLGTACTADHLQKLFRFTDSVVFSFDGDAAGRRAARRALEASLPHANDTRSVRFLFLPADHDPDSYVRANGAGAFENCIANAVPLSRQLVEAASEGCELSTVEGRAHMLATARPLWSALPEGVLKRQLLVELAAAGRDSADALLAQWTPAAPRLPARAVNAAGAAVQQLGRPGHGTGRRISKGAANLLDRAIWLLLHRSDAWTRLDGDAHDVLAAQAAPYDLLFSCVERALDDHGPVMTPAALLGEMRERAQADAQALAVLSRVAQFHESPADADVPSQLSLVIDRLRLQGVQDELNLLVASGPLSEDAHARLQTLIASQAGLKAQLASRQTDTAPAQPNTLERRG